MKRKILKILTYCSILLLFNCQNDDFAEEEHSLHTQDGIIFNRINENELKAKMPSVLEKVQSLAKKDSNLLSKTVNINNDYLINTDEVIEIIHDGITSYTFSISRIETTNLVENLVITVDSFGILYGKIVVYNFTQQEIEALEQKTFVDFTDKIAVKDIEDINSVVNQMMRTGLECVTFIQSGPTCPEEGHHNMSQMNSGQCGAVNGGRFSPSNETMVQMIVDQDCLNGNGGGGIPGDFGPTMPTNPSNPSTPGFGGGGSTPNQPPIITTPKLEVRKNIIPCGQLKSFGDPDKMNLKPSIDQLKSVVNGTNKIEFGVLVEKRLNSDETFRYTKTGLIAGHQTGIYMDISPYSIGNIHTHPRSGNAMFSFGDVKDMIAYYDKVGESKKNDIFATLVCKNDAGVVNVYTLKINDIEKLRTAVDTEWNNSKYADLNDDEKLKEIHIKQSKKFQASNGQLEKSFLEQFSSFGITLFKATDDTMKNWSQLELSNTIPYVKPIPCN